MAEFSYNRALMGSRDKVRFHLQDTTQGAGPLPQDANFSDGEIDGLIAAESTWQRAVAAGFEALSSAWQRYPSFSADGMSLSRSSIADGYAAKAAEWRQRYGSAVSSRMGSRSMTRQDGYSSDVASNET
jgi:hypothetical protein